MSLNQSVNALASVLVNKDELIKLKAQRDELLKKASPKEREAIINKFEQDMAAQVKASTQNANINSQLKGLNSQQKALVGDCLYNLSVATVGYTDIAAQAVGVAKTIQSNPTAALSMGPELKTLGKLSTTLPGQAKSVGELSVNLLKIAAANGITAPKATKGAKPKAVNSSDF